MTLPAAGYEIATPIEDKWAHRPLVRTVLPVISRVNDLKERVKAFYYEVILSPYRCPRCSGRLFMIGQSQCSCQCGNSLDPTLSFQKSGCGAKLTRKTFHYACSLCSQVVPSSCPIWAGTVSFSQVLHPWTRMRAMTRPLSLAIGQLPFITSSFSHFIA